MVRGEEKTMLREDVIGPNPLKICDTNPLDYKTVNGQWVLIPGWWREIKDPPKFTETKVKGKKKG